MCWWKYERTFLQVSPDLPMAGRGMWRAGCGGTLTPTHTCTDCRWGHGYFQSLRECFSCLLLLRNGAVINFGGCSTGASVRLRGTLRLSHTHSCQIIAQRMTDGGSAGWQIPCSQLMRRIPVTREPVSRADLTNTAMRTLTLRTNLRQNVTFYSISLSQKEIVIENNKALTHHIKLYFNII